MSTATPTRRQRLTPDQLRRRRWLVLVPLVPTIALVSAVYLPFVNSTDLWFGLPSLFVWTSFWVLMVTPALLVVEKGWKQYDEPEEAR